MFLKNKLKILDCNCFIAYTTRVHNISSDI